MFDPITNKLIVSRDVVFNESERWTWEFEKPRIEHNDDFAFDTDSTQQKTRSLAEIYASTEQACLAMEPTCFEDAAIRNEWVQTMQEEIDVIEKKNMTWSLVDLPKEKEVIDLKWIYKSKFNSDGSLQRNKACLVAKGYSQAQSIDFF